MPESYLRRTQKHYTAARQTWVRRGKNNFWYLSPALPKSSPVVASEQFPPCLSCPLIMLVCWGGMNFLFGSSTLTIPSQQDVGRGQRDNTDFRAFQREKIGVRQAVCICAVCRVLQVFTIGRSRLILLTPETQIRICPATSNQQWFRQVQLWWELSQRR